VVDEVEFVDVDTFIEPACTLDADTEDEITTHADPVHL
jgi:hypothetical protein